MGCTALLKKASLVGAFFVCLLTTLTAPAACLAPGTLTQVRVSKVLDGDTLRLQDGRNVRLIGVNTPELGHHGRPVEPFAVQAQRRLQALVAANDGRVGLQLGSQAKDHYGRTLAHAYDARGQNLEAQLLAEGLGYLVAIPPNTAQVACQRVAEQQARQARQGLWKKSPVLTPEQLRNSGFAVLRGRVERVQRNRGGLWIELHGPLVLRISPAQLAGFDQAALQRLPGQQVEARGWVIDRARRGGVKNGQARWLLPLSHPAMFEELP